MKNTKKFLALLLCAVMLFCIFGCAPTEDGTSGEITVVIAEDPAAKYTVDLDEVSVTNGLISVLEYLKSKEGITFEMSGTMIDKVGELTNDYAEGKYIYIYTSVAADIDVSEYATTVEYEGQTLTSSGVGASDMHIEDGAIIYIGTISFG